MKLINPTDDQLNAAFAEKVAGWRYRDGAMEYDGSILPFRIWTTHEGKEIGNDVAPNFTQSADAVLPWLEKWSRGGPGYVHLNFLMDAWRLWLETDPWTKIEVRDKSFPRSAVIALLRANGVEVEFTA